MGAHWWLKYVLLLLGHKQLPGARRGEGRMQLRTAMAARDRNTTAHGGSTSARACLLLSDCVSASPGVGDGSKSGFRHPMLSL